MLSELSERLHGPFFSSLVGRSWPITPSTWIPPGGDSEALVWTEECCGWALQNDTNPRCWFWCNKYNSNWRIFSFDNKWSRFRSDAWKGELSWAVTVVGTFSTFSLQGWKGSIKVWDTQNTIITISHWPSRLEIQTFISTSSIYAHLDIISSKNS